MKKIAYLLVLATMLLWVNPVFSAQVTLGWDPVDSPYLAGYEIYFGTAPNTYTHVIDAGINTTLTISGLDNNTTYFFAATAYSNTVGIEDSSYSNEVPYATAPIYPVYRFWSDTYRHHFFTASEAEKNSIIATARNFWRYEGMAFYAFVSLQPGTVPVYRFWSDYYRGHFYTASEAEKNSIIATVPTNVWRYEGIAFYTFISLQPGTMPVYRFWSDYYRGHFYTASEAEKNSIIATVPTNVWRYEGIAFYVPSY